MYFNRYDIVDAWYWYLSHTHEGQGSKKYERLCKLMTYYKLSRVAFNQALNENAKAILGNLFAGDMK